jgi:hypothetical protein
MSRTPHRLRARALPLSVFLVATLLGACSSSTLKSAGSACGSDDECSAGLACFSFGAFTDAGCTTAAKACSKACLLDGECAPFGAGYKCFAACDGTRSCGATQ